MKKLLKLSLMLAVVLTTAGMYANATDFSLIVKKETGKTVRFALNTTEKIQLSIYDQDNVLVHAENISGGANLNRIYNLDALPKGVYFLEAETELKTVVYEITIVDDSAVLSSRPTAEVYKPTLVQQNGMVTLSILNFEETPINVTIYSKDGTEWLSKTFEGKVNFFKKFDMSQLPADTYTFEVAYNGRNFDNTINLKK